MSRRRNRGPGLGQGRARGFDSPACARLTASTAWRALAFPEVSLANTGTEAGGDGLLTFWEEELLKSRVLGMTGRRTGVRLRPLSVLSRGETDTEHLRVLSARDQPGLGGRREQG